MLRSLLEPVCHAFSQASSPSVLSVLHLTIPLQEERLGGLPGERAGVHMYADEVHLSFHSVPLIILPRLNLSSPPLELLKAQQVCVKAMNTLDASNKMLCYHSSLLCSIMTCPSEGLQS